ncbi:hypothetical protein RMSM_06014 [Rhodopirellula maiorica SM1]|uniref:Uncharacterized protein n=1 Tax=Rhodopirellula maiorica SM1 TaxID=1265738 RepID=M5RCE8_9BACT|nr:hypothetical protein RMSM_06014 [Rhodopirellula maiorica SM1]
MSSPTQCPELVSESKRYIPLLWLGMLSRRDIERNGDGTFEVSRLNAILRTEHSLPFLCKLFANLPIKNAADSLLDRLRKLRCDTIGIDIGDLIESEPPNPGLCDALDAISSRNENYSLSIPARTVAHPVNGDVIHVKPLEITSTKDMLLRVCWLSSGRLEDFEEEELEEIVRGHLRS